MDVLFQSNLKDCFGAFYRGIAAIGENIGVTLGECEVHQNWYRECKFNLPNSNVEIEGSSLLDAHSDFPRLCAGFIYGDAESMKVLTNYMGIIIANSQCNDQGIFNILIYGKFLPGTNMPKYVQIYTKK